MPAPALEMVPHRQAHWMRLSSLACVYGLSCGRCRYLFSVQRDWVPRKVLMSHSTSMPSAAKKPSFSATKSLRPMPLGATRTFLMCSSSVIGIVATIHDRTPAESTQPPGGIGALRATEHAEGGRHPRGRDAPVRRERTRRAHSGDRRRRGGDRTDAV